MLVAINLEVITLPVSRVRGGQREGLSNSAYHNVFGLGCSKHSLQMRELRPHADMLFRTA
jgi:hypothetical protein